MVVKWAVGVRGCVQRELSVFNPYNDPIEGRELVGYGRVCRTSQMEVSSGGSPHAGSFGSASSGSTTAYEQLLRTIAELQGDLSVAVSTCSALRQENAVLTSNYGKLKDELLRVESHFAEARRQALAEAEARVRAVMQRGL